MGMEMAKSSTKKSVRYRQSPVITFLVVAAVIFICVTSIVRATSLHTKSKQLAETEKTMELKVEEAKQEQANLDAQEKYLPVLLSRYGCFHMPLLLCYMPFI